MAGLTVVDDTMNDADRKHGYRFGCDGLVGIDEACELLGGCSERTLDRRIADGVFRVGREGGRLVICRKSLMEYIASIEK